MLRSIDGIDLLFLILNIFITIVVINGNEFGDLIRESESWRRIRLGS